MELRLRHQTFWASLHLRSGLLCWPMDEELGLGATYDQLPLAPEALQSSARALKETLAPPTCSPAAGALSLPSAKASEDDVQPHLWMWVNPNLACPVPGHVSAKGPLPELLPLAGPKASSSGLACLPEDLLPSPSQVEKKVTLEEDASQVGPSPLQKIRSAHGCAPEPRKAKAFWSRSRKMKRAQGGQPRPPLNYCTLISLALSSSADSSLTVQGIYQFLRQHFPFFRTASEGWKNSVRHNLCFSSSFEKTTNFVCLEGNRQSRLWKLTGEGHHRFQEEMQGLPEDMVGLVHQSMDNPELMRCLSGC